MEKRRIHIGWLSYRIEALQQRRLQCFKCLEPGHASANCRNPVDRSLCCYRCGVAGHESSNCSMPLNCPACKAAGKECGHKIGGNACTAGKRDRKGRTSEGPTSRKGRGPPASDPPSISAGETRESAAIKSQQQEVATPKSGPEQLPPRERRSRQTDVKMETEPLHEIQGTEEPVVILSD